MAAIYHHLGFLLIAALLLNSPQHVKGRTLEPSTSKIESAPSEGAIETIKGDDGDVVDCVDIYKQPAFHHPLLKDHNIQMDPGSSPLKKNESHPTRGLRQSWQLNGVCSKGSVPIRRRQLQDRQPPKTKSNQTIKGPHFEYATVSTIPTSGKRVYGGSATLSVWDPYVAREDDFSDSTLLVQLSSTAYLVAGWIVFPKQYGDYRPRLFTFFTTDNSTKSRCWDLDCHGFVQVNSNYALGSIITPVSTIGGPLYAIKISIFQDKKTANWWLSIEDTAIGYWPATLFEGVPKGAEYIEWGGTIYDSVGNSKHTQTDMGNGLFPDVGTNNASNVCSLQYIDDSFTLRIPDRSNLGTEVTNTWCYDAQILPELDPIQGLCFLFGGSGTNKYCP